ncbi:flagellar basal body P-ring protein FlgI [Aquicella lusitana]|uniref:Flagellar P-ring protein n=1 Tax=Aquicella lusitana TaxID=254246 RepID=A0A370GAB3_9COXI|nr:flagellar basal body P-ring protein FlgI [Aquicella lusitana]RDI39969.1 flagellar P-ring protein precursor FlgI [Aquicella lusitana]VVC74572.1 Flagellar P-ring protein [Aquicella lusitana]
MRSLIYLYYIICVFILSSAVFAARIKDITALAGVRDNQLVGYGLIVGLDGTGDKTNQAPFTDQTFKNMLLEFGIRLPFDRGSQLKNVAAVAIHAKLPPFARIGQKIDVTILSLGNATSLRGGSLLMAPLKGADGKVYAMAQGNVVVSGFGAQGSDGSKVTVNVTSSGTIPNGATIENTIDTPFVQQGEVTFELIRPDFTTALRIEKAINKEFGYKVAEAQDAASVKVNFHHMALKGEGGLLDEASEKRRYVPLISRIENIQLKPAAVGARVVVNSRTGTIVIGDNVTIAPVAVSHGNLAVIITERPYVSQPEGFSEGKTVQGEASDININQQNNRAFVFAPGASLNDLVETINRVGAAPGDLIAILEAIKAAGALNADLEVI